MPRGHNWYQRCVWRKLAIACLTLGWKSMVSSPWSLVILAPPIRDVMTMMSHPRPSRFSPYNIEKLGVAWGRGYTSPISLTDPVEKLCYCWVGCLIYKQGNSLIKLKSYYWSCSVGIQDLCFLSQVGLFWPTHDVWIRGTTSPVSQSCLHPPHKDCVFCVRHGSTETNEKRGITTPPQLWLVDR